ncbi:MAG: DNA gyrase inhibitor YacG [Alphaproteobacteria bacterium]|nr:MAG: DNA gyrase inhibitor YacG [Alphaproteobacteria bacterium]
MAEAPASGSCPICGKPTDPKIKPFCSKRCADVDLSRWLKGAYAIPAVEPPDEWDEAAQSQPPLQEDDPDATRH